MVPVAPFLALYRTYNLGVAFSMLEDMHGWFIVSMRLVIVVFVLWLWRKTAADRTFAHLGFAFIIAGAAGNLLDRFFYGHVIDYILFHTQTWSFAVFNLADSFITIGAACVSAKHIKTAAVVAVAYERTGKTSTESFRWSGRHGGAAGGSCDPHLTKPLSAMRSTPGRSPSMSPFHCRWVRSLRP
ncbi:signal peptidase (SPase) II domain-containing protein [Ditylenchus destructor]|nr:signal peptidase (SPase) II domain-containing protein [Ditylenchus destructor]